MPGLGEELRAAREARNLSLSDVSEQIHIRSVYLQSIEEERWASIAAPVYVRGFIRTYARCLGLDPEAAVERFNASLGDVEATRPAPVLAMPVRARRGTSPWLLLSILAAVVLVGFVGYNYYQLQVENAAPPPAPGPLAAQPHAAKPATPVPAGPPRPTVAASPTLELRLTQRAWLLVQVDGVKALEGILPAGWSGQFHGRSVFVRTGNAGGVDLTVNGRDLGTMGASGDVVQKTYTLAQK